MFSRTIDHVVWTVPDLSAAAIAAERAGFKTTPVASHPPNMGTSNRLVQFEQCNFIEFLEVDRVDGVAEHRPGEAFSFGAWNRDFIKTGAGVSMLVFATLDAKADAREFATKGLLNLSPFSFGRRAKQPDGRELEVAFELAFGIDAQIPDLACFTCHNRFPENFWKSDFQTHPNGARGIERIEIGGPSPRQLADYLGKVTGAVVEAHSETWRLALTDGQEIVVRQHPKIAVLGLDATAPLAADIGDAAWGDCRLRLSGSEGIDQ